MKKENKGITLVALVITVIVLLILAGTAISIAINGGDIFSKSTAAREEWNNGVKKEEASITEILELADDATNPDKQAMKIVVNSGSDGKVILPIETGTVDWGDGVTTGKSDDIIDSSYKVASADGTKIAGTNVTDLRRQHQYDTNNQEYTVTITGVTSTEITSMSFGVYSREKIIKVLQWGQMELDIVNFEECINLTSIASPTSKSFKNTEELWISFYNCTSLTSIPADLFKYCTNIKHLDRTFANCTSLTSIPTDLLKNCTNVETFFGMFQNCTGLTGQAIPIWERMENGTTYNYEPSYMNNNIVRGPDGHGCYYNCIGLTNYNSIPSYWKVEPVQYD